MKIILINNNSPTNLMARRAIIDLQGEVHQSGCSCLALIAIYSYL